MADGGEQVRQPGRNVRRRATGRSSSSEGDHASRGLQTSTLRRLWTRAALQSRKMRTSTSADCLRCGSRRSAPRRASRHLVTAVKARGNADGRAVRRLIRSASTSTSAKRTGRRRLHWAARAGDVPTVELLIRAGAEVNAVNRYGSRRWPGRRQRQAPMSSTCCSRRARTEHHGRRAPRRARLAHAGGPRRQRGRRGAARRTART